MKVKENEIKDSTDILLTIDFEEEDEDLYNKLIELSEAVNKTPQEIIEEAISLGVVKFTKGYE